ncbi:MAG: LolA family protein, partial [bacterium]
MKKLSIYFNLCLIVLSVFIILLAANIKKTYASGNNAIIKKIELKYSSINSIAANFIQKEVLKGYSQSITSKGSFFYKRPDKLAWIYTLPYKQKEVYINKRLYIINGKLKQVLVYNMNNSAAGGFPPNVISLLGKIRKYFKIINIKQNYKTNSVQIEMKPLKFQLAKLININFEKSGYKISSIIIVTAQGRMETYY